MMCHVSFQVICCGMWGLITFHAALKQETLPLATISDLLNGRTSQEASCWMNAIMLHLVKD